MIVLPLRTAPAGFLIALFAIRVNGFRSFTDVAGMVAIILFVVRLYVSARLPYFSQPSASADVREWDPPFTLARRT
ncbi:hypothetical protein [Planomonospora parontospora]|uniref:hypothetical protein n=1 Tax=Planomonospora parontospora TaxID=58119 RepID=UPI00166FA433|nr:hypothetical protein [Planomonospora parontospora]GGL53246.1 hypothetical protein GCM10014719_63200 [Planomonospora parontospora subsp. antibiotica]GII19525.1 hypothetical protein Ppa05_62510 [Planomonospora parontospora subsp. antibiotica]